MPTAFQAGDIIKVRHNLWQGQLIVGSEPGRLHHAAHRSPASFDLAGDLLWVRWDHYGAELFMRQGDGYVVVPPTRDAGDRQGLGHGGVDLFGRPYTLIGATPFDIDLVSLALPDGSGSVLVRPATSDIPVFEAIFLAKEYDTPLLNETCDIVVDLGANTGLSSVYFAAKCPKARIVAVEPARSNGAVLSANIQHRPTIVAVEAAIWSEDGCLRMQESTDLGEKLQPWGFRTVEHGGGYEVEALCLPTLMRRYGIGTIDVLKIDIEGAEYNLFSNNTEHWLPKVRAIIIETHERFCPGVDALVERVLATDFTELAAMGENRLFVRRG